MIDVDKSLWKFKAVFGEDYVNNYFNCDPCMLDFEDFLNGSPYRYYLIITNKSLTEPHRGYFLSSSKNWFGCIDVEIIEFSMKEAYRIYGIDLMEEAHEKSYTEVDIAPYKKYIRTQKLERIIYEIK